MKPNSQQSPIHYISKIFSGVHVSIKLACVTSCLALQHTLQTTRGNPQSNTLASRSRSLAGQGHFQVSYGHKYSLNASFSVKYCPFCNVSSLVYCLCSLFFVWPHYVLLFIFHVCDLVLVASVCWSFLPVISFRFYDFDLDCLQCELINLHKDSRPSVLGASLQHAGTGLGFLVQVKGNLLWHMAFCTILSFRHNDKSFRKLYVLTA